MDKALKFFTDKCSLNYIPLLSKKSHLFAHYTVHSFRLLLGLQGSPRPDKRGRRSKTLPPLPQRLTAAAFLQRALVFFRAGLECPLGVKCGLCLEYVPWPFLSKGRSSQGYVHWHHHHIFGLYPYPFLGLQAKGL